MKRKRIEMGRDGTTGSVRNRGCVRGKKRNRGREKERNVNSGHA